MEINSQIDLIRNQKSEIPFGESITLGCWVNLLFAFLDHLIWTFVVASIRIFTVAWDTRISTFTTLNIIAFDLLIKVHHWWLLAFIIFLLGIKEVKFMLVCGIRKSNYSSIFLWREELSLSCGREEIVTMIMYQLHILLILLETNGRVFKHWEFSLWHPRITCSHQLEA